MFISKSIFPFKNDFLGKKCSDEKQICLNLPDSFVDISLTNIIFRKYSKEKSSSELNLQLSFKYFAKFCFIPK